MNIYINNIKITLLADAGSLNVGTTLNMVQNRVKESNEKRIAPQSVLPPGFNVPSRETLEEEGKKELESFVPAIPTV